MEEKFSSYRWVVEASLVPLHFGVALNLFAVPPVFPLIMEDFSLSRGTVSLLMTVVFLVFTLFLIPGSALSAKINAKNAIVLSGFLMAGTSWFFLPNDFVTLLPLRMLFGIGASILLTATATIILHWFKPSERPVVNAFNLACQGSGATFAMVFTVPLAENFGLGWQLVLSSYGWFVVFGTVLWLAFGRTSPAASTEPDLFSLSTLREMLKEKNTWLLSLAPVGPIAMFIAYSSWLPTYYNEVFGMSLSDATSLLGILPLMGVIINVPGGLLLSRVGLHRPFLFVPGLLFPIGALVAIGFNNPLVIFFGLVILGVSLSIFLPTVFTVAMELPGTTPEKAAIVTAAALTLANGATIISPLFVGLSTDLSGSYLPSLILLAIIPLTAVLASWKLPETGSRNQLK